MAETRRGLANERCRARGVGLRDSAVGCSPKDDGYREGAFGLHAITLQGGLDGRPAGSRDVPRRPRLGIFGVRHVGAGLVADADGVKGEQDGVHDGGEQRMEDMGDVHDAFDQEEEEGEHGDDDVELGGAVGGRSAARRELFRRFSTYDSSHGRG